ncbi:hypothetical protein VFPFJ_02350 [Purpureocillium lilacinum]|uniref:Uncharacterized protein n=1 Tax=Purpureocillium lilacinum TaxID=33203 RepID=A0A179HUS0_PURLI|nr:hypothetical protein VFPFJ_02350 [Purpureocillium lilacinum]OAQ93189.1 hypothetical protein VFPFJ_02350 [Purpureocillium lilacinum]
MSLYPRGLPALPALVPGDSRPATGRIGGGRLKMTGLRAAVPSIRLSIQTPNASSTWKGWAWLVAQALPPPPQPSGADPSG